MRILRRWAFGVGAAAVLTASAGAAEIVKTDGTLVTGDISGQVVLLRGLTNIAVVEGHDIQRIDKDGVRLKAAAIVIHGGMPLGSDRALYKATLPLDVLRVILPAASKTTAAKELDGSKAVALALTGQAETAPGMASLPFRGGRVFFTKQSDAQPPKYPVVGQLLGSGSGMKLTPVLTVATVSGPVTVPVPSIESLRKE